MRAKIHWTATRHVYWSDKWWRIGVNPLQLAVFLGLACGIAAYNTDIANTYRWPLAIVLSMIAGSLVSYAVRRLSAPRSDTGSETGTG